MANMYFKEHCPCGNSVDISGYGSEVLKQITSWRKTHTPHANAIAKTIVEKPKTSVWPWTTTLNIPASPSDVFTFDTTSLENNKEVTPGG